MQGLGFFGGNGFMLLSSSFSINIMSQFSSSLKNFAPIIDKAHV